MTEFLRITIHVLEIIVFYLGCIQEMWFPVKLANTEKKKKKSYLKMMLTTKKRYQRRACLNCSCRFYYFCVLQFL